MDWRCWEVAGWPNAQKVFLWEALNTKINAVEECEEGSLAHEGEEIASESKDRLRGGQISTMTIEPLSIS